MEVSRAMAIAQQLTIINSEKPRLELAPTPPSNEEGRINVRLGSPDLVRLAAWLVRKGYTLTSLLFTDSKKRPLTDDEDSPVEEELRQTLTSSGIKTFYQQADEALQEWQVSGLEVRDREWATYDLRSDGKLIIIKSGEISNLLKSIEEYLNGNA